MPCIHRLGVVSGIKACARARFMTIVHAAPAEMSHWRHHASGRERHTESPAAGRPPTDVHDPEAAQARKAALRLLASRRLEPCDIGAVHVVGLVDRLPARARLRVLELDGHGHVEG